MKTVKIFIFKKFSKRRMLEIKKNKLKVRKSAQTKIKVNKREGFIRKDHHALLNSDFDDREVYSERNSCRNEQEEQTFRTLLNTQ